MDARPWGAMELVYGKRQFGKDLTCSVTPINAWALVAARIASTATPTPPSVPFLKPMGKEETLEEIEGASEQMEEEEGGNHQGHLPNKLAVQLGLGSACADGSPRDEVLEGGM